MSRRNGTGTWWARCALGAAAAGVLNASAMADRVAEDDGVAVNGVAVTVEPVASEPADSATAAAREEAQRLQAEASLRRQRLEAELAQLKEEHERLKLEYELAQQRQKNELMKLQLERDRLSAAAALRDAQRGEEDAGAKAELADLQQAQQLRDAKLAAELAEAKAKVQRLQSEGELRAAEHRAQLASLQQEQATVAAHNALEAEKLRALAIEAQAEQAKLAAELTNAQSKLGIRSAANQWRDEIDGEIAYREQPFEDGVLYISDRRISMNGPIVTGAADYVCDRIDYFNNQSRTLPIFIVIDNCPGGSVMQGYRIVKAIEASDAPVHVVVKSFAASMAAVITTLADHSYVYPNAIIMHHQMSAGVSGNMTDIEQQVETLREWERRLAEPVAAKMGVSVEEFKAQMYDARKSGDWEVFGDEAVELKWANQTVNEVYEEGIRKRPQGEMPRPWWFALLSQDETGKSYVKLPPLEPMDAYLMYNPNRFYRVDGQ